MKKFFAAVLVLVMVVCMFAGCNGSNNEEGSALIKIGGIGPTTGGAAIYGNAVKNAMELAVEEVNAKGGVQFELSFQDDANDAETSVNAYGKLVDWGMQILIGPTTSTPSAAVAAEAEADRIFMLTPSASSVAVIENKTCVFQMCFSDPNQGLASADYMAEHGLGDSVAIIYKSDDVYSVGIYEKFIAEAAVKGINVVYTGTFEEANKTEFSSQLTAAKQSGAEFIFLPIYCESIAPLMTQAASMGYDVNYFGVDGMDGILEVEGFDTTLTEGTYMFTPYSADSTEEKSAHFTEAYIAKFGEVPNQFAADAYDCVFAAYEACTAYNLTADMSAEEICNVLSEKFADGSFVFSGVTGADMVWDASGAVSKSPLAVIIKDGAYTSAD